MKQMSPEQAQPTLCIARTGIFQEKSGPAPEAGKAVSLAKAEIPVTYDKITESLYIPVGHEHPISILDIGQIAFIKTELIHKEGIKESSPFQSLLPHKRLTQVFG